MNKETANASTTLTTPPPSDQNYQRAEIKEEAPTGYKRFVGLLFCVLYTFCMSSNTLFVKKCFVPATEKILIRCGFQFFILLPLITWKSATKRSDLFGGSPSMFKILVIRGTATTFSSLFMYESLARIPLGDATSISFCSIFFAGIISRIWLKEPYTKVDMLFATVSMIGIVLISKPPFMFDLDEQSYGATEYLGIGFGVLAAFTLGLQFSITRRLGKADPILTVFYYSVLAVVICFIILFATQGQVLPCLSELPFLLMVGVTGLLGQFCLVLALKFERTTTFAIMRSTTIFQVFLLQVFVLEDIPDVLSIAGASLIFISAFGIALRKFLKDRNNNSVGEVKRKN